MRWQFDSSGTALGTKVGRREDDVIRVQARRGCALFGPYLAVPEGLLKARILFRPGARGSVRIELTADNGATRLAKATITLAGQTAVEQEVRLARHVEGLEVRLFCRSGCDFAIAGLEVELERDHRWTTPHPARPVGTESGKSYADKLRSGFVDRFLSGPAIMEVGYKGYDHATVPIVPQAVGVDVGYLGYDGRRFPFADNSLDRSTAAIASSIFRITARSCATGSAC